MASDERARVVLTSTITVDGKIAPSGAGPLMTDANAAQQWRDLHPASATGAAARRAEHLNAVFGPTALLEGSGTFDTDTDTDTDTDSSSDVEHPRFADLQPDPLYQDHLPGPVAEGSASQLWFVVVDSRGRTAWTRTSDAGRTLLVLVARSTPASYLHRLRTAGISYLFAGDEGVDLTTALHRLRQVLGVRWVVADSGGRLNAALLAQGLVEQVHLLVLPALVGGAATPTLVDGDLTDRRLGTRLPARLRLRRVQVEDDGLLCLEYAVLGTASLHDVDDSDDPVHAALDERAAVVVGGAASGGRLR